MSFWNELGQDLKSLKQKNLYRTAEVISSPSAAKIFVGKKRFINFSSNNYLGLATHPKVVGAGKAALERWGAGSGASRLLSGSLKIHTDLEERLAWFKGEEASAIFSSGYLANLGVMTALLNEKDLVLLDRLNHASLVDAARLSKAKLWVYPHRDVTELERLLKKASSFRRKLVVTDAYFGMDGDVAPLDKILDICERNGALLMIDEAHSTGVFGKTGRGLTEHFGLSGKIHVVMGTLSKALGSVGGFITGKNILRQTIVNRSKEFIYTTAPAPAASAAALESLKIIGKEPHLRKKLWKNVDFLRKGLNVLGFNLMNSEGPVIPIIVGETAKTLLLRDVLRKEGIFAPAIRPPTVPKGTDRIRISLMATHTKEDLEKLLGILKKVRNRHLSS